jgi:hypothetical protein
VVRSQGLIADRCRPLTRSRHQARTSDDQCFEPHQSFVCDVKRNFRECDALKIVMRADKDDRVAAAWTAIARKNARKCDEGNPVHSDESASQRTVYPATPTEDPE